MSEHWKDRLRRIIDERGLKMKELSRLAGVGDTGVRDLLTRTDGGNIKTVAQIARALGMTLAELHDGDDPNVQHVQVTGRISAGESWEPVETEPERVAIRVEGGQPVVISVTGDSMSPVYRRDDLIIGVRRAGTAADNLIGLDCIVQTEDGRRFVKYLARGLTPGRFNLRSYNPSNEDIPNVKLAWVAPILWVRRGQSR